MEPDAPLLSRTKAAALSGGQMGPLLWPSLRVWIFSVKLTFFVPPYIRAEDAHLQRPIVVLFH